ncbi:SANT/Myb_domain [Hexamita inflata]|uniref:SANT/Myb domain n=1 Tax=Hexamita inflata TaxID=28002 RepID=A0AA86PVL3_9EUKA|nr:SANT/Myb domain [Hexamita inflata]CAI9944962.1 SANT/Myb domain [Hexamita inflata]
MQKTIIIKSRTNKRWTAEEDALFQTLLYLYYRDFQVISEQMNKSYNQVRSHYYNKVKKHSVVQKAYINAETNHIVGNEHTTQKQENIYQLIVFDCIK